MRCANLDQLSHAHGPLPLERRQLPPLGPHRQIAEALDATQDRGPEPLGALRRNQLEHELVTADTTGPVQLRRPPLLRVAQVGVVVGVISQQALDGVLERPADQP